MNPVPSPYVGFHKDAHGVRSLWERFNAGVLDTEERRTPYLQLLLSEWQRCSALGVDVAMTKGRRLSEEEFRQRRQAEQLLLQTSVPVVQDVSHFLVDVPGIMILTERTGTILHISGDPVVRERAASQSNIIEGSQWNELSAGTNGMGTALSKGQPVHVFATEHFCEGWHSWSCAAAPIFDTDGQTVLGIIDFTAVETDFRDQALGLTVSVANSIQARMALHRELERRRILSAFSDAARHYPHDDMLALDVGGRPVMFTPNERCRQIAERWVSTRHDGVSVQSTIDVTAPHSESRIGSIVLLGRSSGHTRVIRPPPAPAPDAVERFGDFTTRDPDTRRMFDDLQRIAAADVNLLIIGETGTGKELLARQVHACSPRRNEPYLAVNCGAISEQLMESTFFGYVRGAFSGADPRGRAGYFESAKGGTLFLDEVGELPPAMQASLLRVLEDGSFQRVGSCETLRASCRIIAATNRNLVQLIAEGRFRQDLYFRLKVVQRTIKPLRERPCDIGLLAEHFAEAMRGKHGLGELRITPAAHAALAAYDWPGNAREMRNAIEAAVLCSVGAIDLECLPPEVRADGDRGGSAPVTSSTPSESLGSVRDYERQIIVSMLRKYRKANRVASVLGIARSTLYRKFAELNINPGEFTGAATDTDSTH
ncbi:transcriptional regulator of acetoin/glycerol metabolism [Panacagrimonas perspica]|uniref:Transcriptional regulator of acetoin/glycerol metabolism n=1 Tax=Panacagrimonas perspica TaxID=381431 RepID=A0A4R7PA85_9GAMM|nr:sigma-54-dependent Fis family transcriptional regulator [Panacagrimonas perspica]TDU30935.1 transcriptional regulator of acetoin/glycerol metabolism [Panacagrimonas perspica]THD01995.1 AAA family ATPase [Panacagrimonas perspica]